MVHKLVRWEPGTIQKDSDGSYLFIESHFILNHINLPLLWPILEKFFPSKSQLLLIHKLSQKMWLKAKKLTLYHDIPAQTPLWHNPRLDHLIQRLPILIELWCVYIE